MPGIVCWPDSWLILGCLESYILTGLSQWVAGFSVGMRRVLENEKLWRGTNVEQIWLYYCLVT